MLISKEEIERELVNRCGSVAVEKLRAARVAVVGLGGLGSNIAILLTRMGVAHLHLIDFDKVFATSCEAPISSNSFKFSCSILFSSNK